MKAHYIAYSVSSYGLRLFMLLISMCLWMSPKWHSCLLLLLLLLLLLY